MRDLAATFSAEERLIGRVAVADWSAGARRAWPAAWFEGIDWRKAAALARRHTIRPMLAAAAREIGWTGVPTDVRAALEAAQRQSVANAMCHIALLREIVAAAEARGLRVLAMKGEALAARLYGDPFIRESLDLDLLAHPDDGPAIDAILADLGCVESQAEVLSPRQAAIIRGFRKDRVFRHLATGVEIERHWALDANRYRIATDFDALWAGRGIVRIADFDVAVLGEGALIQYLGVHAARHGWDRWKWAGDMAALLRSAGSGAEAARAAAGASLFDSWVLLVKTLAGIEADVGDARARSLARWALSIGRMPRAQQDPPRLSRKARWATAAYSASLAGPSALAFALWAWMHDERDWRALRLPDPLTPLYYLLRPFTSLGRRIAALAG